jgi:putative ABC transport system ATP-binding protein
MPETAIYIKDITKTFGEGETAIQALRGINLEIFLGELFLIMGPSGSGKTTLLSIIGGVLSPTSGSVKVLGSDLSTLTYSENTRLRADKIGFMFQEYHLLPNLSAAENVAIPLLIKRETWEKALKQARNYLSAVGLEARSENSINQLSTGEKQRVAFARALVHEPQLLICDEPTAALDTETGIHVMELMRERALSPERCLVIVTHDNRILPYADRIAFIIDGRVSEIKTGHSEDMAV